MAPADWIALAGFAVPILTVAVAWGKLAADIAGLHRRIKSLEEHQRMQSSRVWSLATRKDDIQ